VADWTTEPFVRGLYSFPLAHTEPRHREALAAPLGGKLFFAGEATDLEGHSGTVHGAIATGRRAADEVLRSFA
jgi:monoamine oxidase